MAEHDALTYQATASPEDIKAVATRLEGMLFSLTAIHGLCNEKIGNPPQESEDAVSTFVIVRELLRSTARDLEICADTLSNSPAGIGFYEHHFGKI